MTFTVIILLLALGLLMLLIEILLIPGTTIVGILGFLLMVIGTWAAYKYLGNTAGNYVLLFTVLTSCLALFLTFRQNTWNKFALNAEIKGKVNTFDEDLIKPGDTGLSISRLAPSGKAMIKNNYYEVESTTDFIDNNREVIVVSVRANKIYVKLKNPN